MKKNIYDIAIEHIWGFIGIIFIAIIAYRVILALIRTI